MHHLPHDTSTGPRRIVADAGEVANPFILPNTTRDASQLSVKAHNSESVKPYRANITVIILLRTASLSFTFEFLPTLIQYKNRTKALKSGVNGRENKIGPLVLAGVTYNIKRCYCRQCGWEGGYYRKIFVFWYSAFFVTFIYSRTRLLFLYKFSLI
jgi:hypothetical protein